MTVQPPAGVPAGVPAVAPVLKMVIGGAQVAAVSGETFDVVSPVTGAVIARVPKAGQVDVDRAVAAASKPSTAACQRP